MCGTLTFQSQEKLGLRLGMGAPTWPSISSVLLTWRYKCSTWGRARGKTPSQSKQAVAQSSYTRLKMSQFEKKAKRDCPDATVILKSSLWKLLPDLEERACSSTPDSSYRGLVFKLTHSIFFLKKQNLSYLLFGPSLKNTEEPFTLRKNLRSMGK